MGEAYPDVDKETPGDWVQIDVAPVEKLKRSVSLDEIKRNTKLKDILLVKQSRLSVVPLSKAHFDLILKLGESGNG